MASKLRFKISHRGLKKPEVKKFEDKDRERVPPPKKKRKDGKR